MKFYNYCSLSWLRLSGMITRRFSDIDVHEQMFEAVLNPYINPKENYRVPDCFGMFSDQINLEIKTAILKFTRRDSEYAAMHQPTIRDPMDDFQSETVVRDGE